VRTRGKPHTCRKMPALGRPPETAYEGAGREDEGIGPLQVPGPKARALRHGVIDVDDAGPKSSHEAPVGKASGS